MKKDKTGVYKIQCSVSGKMYVGSSIHMYRRWSGHRCKLRQRAHPSPRLQRAWNKHGEDRFIFSVLEECLPDERYAREQFWINHYKPDYNSMPIVTVITKEMRRKMLAGIQSNRFTQATHCPKGHPYDDVNTKRMKSKKGRQCRECARVWARARVERETSVQREERRKRVKAYHERTRASRLLKMKEYMDAHKAEKQAYDRERLRRQKLELM